MSQIPKNFTYVKKFNPEGPFYKGRPGAVLPKAYRKFWHEWYTQKPVAVHYIPEPGKWKRNPKTGEVTPVQNVKLPLKFPLESNQQLWGGEGVVQGYIQKIPLYGERNPHFWVPQLTNTVIHSEILNKYMTVIVTQRAIDLIHKHFGFDHYILKTPACDLQSELAVKMKRKLLITLLNNDLQYNDHEKRKNVYETYKQYLLNYTEEEIEWYGLTLDEALAKYENEQEDSKQILPLKHQYRLDLVNELLDANLQAVDSASREKKSWLSKINPFKK